MDEAPHLCENCYGPVDLCHPRTLTIGYNQYLCGCQVPKNIRDTQDALWGFIEPPAKPSLLKRLISFFS